ncbi:hypothetical protein AAF712_006347 [Marasmius tenuissimus]|uniref:Uncharacterized protein n=1 Tax=Marasmius tenuissimus TaxID=585030 RepID=A0ABR2ZZ42_9AGAR
MQGKIQPKLFRLLRDYCSLAPPRLISPLDNVSFADLNEFLVEQILLNSHLQKFPPAEQYQKSFWKSLISHLEQLQRHANDASTDELEIDDRILEHYLSSLPPGAPPSGSSQASVRDQICGLGLPIRQPPTKSFITHLWKSESSAECSDGDIDLASFQTTTLHESRTTIESGTTGLRTWGASLRLAEYLIAHPGSSASFGCFVHLLMIYVDLIRNRRILELGSGIGFLGIVVASLQQLLRGVSSLWLTDVNEDVLSQCRQNLSLDCNLSSKHPDVHYRTLDWFDALEDEQGGLHSFLRECSAEIILGADVASV